MIARILALGLALLATEASAETRTFYDSMGRETGRSVTSSTGATIYRDPMGRETGRSTTSPSGTTTFRDSMGRETGRSTVTGGRP